MSALFRHTASLALIVMGGLVSGCGAANHRGPPSSSAAREGGGPGCREAAVSDANSNLAPAQMRLTSLESRRSRQRVDGSIEALAQAADESGFTDLGMLIDLAALQIERASMVDAPDPRGDLDRAEENLARALVIEPHSAPALNELALLHLTKAKMIAGDKTAQAAPCPNPKAPSYRVIKASTGGRQELETAMGICLRGVREHPTYAPFRNTAGLVEFELHDAQSAIRQFDRAVALYPSYVDAQANLAASLLSVRRYDAAERAFDRVIALGGDEYQALLGRALARRGQINGSNFRAQVASAESDLERCKQLDPERPEAYYDDAVLTEQLHTLTAPTEHDLVLQRARSLFDIFLAKAGERPEYAQEVRLAKQRMRDLAPIFAPGSESSGRAPQ